MTVCVAAICDNGKTLVLVADKMIGIGFIESEPDINKLIELHRGWWVLFAGDDISPVFDIIDYAKEAIREKQEKANVPPTDPITLATAMEVIQESYERKRLEEAERLYLRPIGWDMGSLSGGGHSDLPDFGEIKSRVADYSLSIELLVAGFSEGKARVFSLLGYGNEKGLIKRHDVPGFHSIGSGGWGASFMMYYRDMSYKKPVREAVYYALEAKLFGEQASGVGERTDMYIATPDGKLISLEEEDTIEQKLVPIWYRLRPRWLGKTDRLVLNSLKVLEPFERIREETKRRKKKKPKPKPPSSEDHSSTI